MVIKVGSRILTAGGHEKRVKNLVEDILLLHQTGIRMILVSSGAIAHGMKVLGLEKRPTAIPLQQACAAIGQNRLMQIYQNYFSSRNVPVGQVLLTWDDLRSKKRYLNLRNTMFQLLECGAVPVINENDSVGIEEIQFGNNDILGAQVALLVQADLFVNLTDVGGLYDRNPHQCKSAVHIPVVSQMSASIHKLAETKRSQCRRNDYKLKARKWLPGPESILSLVMGSISGSPMSPRKNSAPHSFTVRTSYVLEAEMDPFTGRPKGYIVMTVLESNNRREKPSLCRDTQHIGQFQGRRQSRSPLQRQQTDCRRSGELLL